MSGTRDEPGVNSARRATANSRAAAPRARRTSSGFTLLEMVVTMSVLTVLSLGVIPLYRNEVKRGREQRLREALREMRTAIDEFHRDTAGMQCNGLAASAAVAPPVPPQAGGGMAPGNQQPGAPAFFIDPRSRVMVSDCTLFDVDNPDRYPPDLDTLVKGVSITPRAAAAGALVGSGPNGPDPLQNSVDPTSTEELTKKKVYLRAIPVDPMTNTAEWDVRSCYDPADATSWGGENVFDVRSKSSGVSLGGEKYSDW